MFETIQFSRLSQNIADQVRQAILSKELKPGDRLPSEKELAQKFGVSKASVREALRALEALGLVQIKQGVSGGAFVCEVGADIARESLFNFIFFQNPSIHEFTQLRSMLEPRIVEIVAPKIEDSDLMRLAENLQETKQHLDSGHFFYELDISFHREISLITQNRLLSFIVDSMQNALLNIKHALHPDIQFSRQVYIAHKNIYQALSMRDPYKASQEMLKHIQEVEEGLIALQQKKEAQEELLASNNLQKQ